MLIRTQWRALCYGILVIASAQSQAGEDVIGTAYSPGTEQVVYVETYTSESATRVQVRYQNAEGELLANKQLDFSRDRHAPDVNRKDYRFDSTLTIETEASTTTLQEQRDGEETLNATLEVVGKLVIDAGFDFFVQDRWDDLLTGEKISFRYLVPTRKAAVKLELKRRKCGSSEQMVCFRIKASNWIVAAIMPPIDLEYEQASQRLMRFAGLGQLNDSEGKKQEVDIRYRYPATAAPQ